MNQLQKIKEHIAEFGSLPNGFDECKKALNNYMENELPHSRLRQVISIAQQKVVRYVQDTLKLDRQLIPIDMKQIALDDYIKQMNTEKWDEIFTNERYESVLHRAACWQKEALVVNRTECTRKLTNYFYEQFQVCTEDIINNDHPIEQIMFERHDIALFQMNPYDIETVEREKITVAMLKAVVQASNELAIYMYDTYVNELEKHLNEICPEQGDLFQGSLTQERCLIEVQTLVLRVARPVVTATIRWPHVYKDNRVEAAKELTRVAPTIAFNVYEDNRTKSSSLLSDGVSILAKTIGTVLEMYMNKNAPMALVMTLFRRL
ncbi:unnamed protein product [Rotaria sordida]|uniref:Uncharacterized protein n=1 Tax=Rotaria sordida TaxID=392033 RepID=A0A820AL72_9BILA|nr:unnamed protein product [Rotaria sordida]CAF4187197.1 unnamed protein product [Rotaria sordida]